MEAFTSTAIPVPPALTGHLDRWNDLGVTLEAPNIGSLLKRAAQSAGDRGIITYPSGNPETGLKTTYDQLLLQAELNIKALLAIPGFGLRSIVVLHLDDHLDNITLFWSVILAGGIPCMSTPFTNIPAQREKHIQHLCNLLNNPIWITRAHLLSQFEGLTLKLHTIEGLDDLYLPPRAAVHSKSEPHPSPLAYNISRHYISRPADLDDTALLMLTSGALGMPRLCA